MPRPKQQAGAGGGDEDCSRRERSRCNYLPGNALGHAHFGQRVSLLLSFALHLLQRRLRSFFL